MTDFIKALFTSVVVYIIVTIVAVAMLKVIFLILEAFNMV